MHTSIPTTRGLPRLNPFAFRSDTDSSFVLLIISVLGSSLIFFNELAYTAPFLHQQVVAYTHCALEFQRVKSTNYTDFYAYLNALEAANTTYGRCARSFLFMLSALSIGGVALVLAVAAGIYWSFPLWKLRRGKLVPLSSEDAPEVVDYLSNLCREVGLTSHPRFVWNPLNLMSGALAFGRLRRYYVALSGGLVTQFYTDQPAFRAIVLHELAHLHNADVDKTYFTVAIWWAFVAVALVPFVAIGLVQNLLDVTLDIGWRVLPLTMFVYLTRNAVLRAREYYADVRASTWDGSSVLSRVLKALPRSRKGWQVAVSVHPDPDERCRVLDETQRLFRLNFWEAFGVGVAVTIAFSNIQTLVGWIGSLTGIQRVAVLVLELLVPVIIFAPIIVGVLGLNTWRATFAKLARDEAPHGAGLLGLSLGFGLILGRLLLLSPHPSPGSTDLRATLIYDLPWNVLLLIGLFFFFRWIAAGASVWLEIAATRRSPRLIYTSGLIIASVVLVVWLEYLFSYRDLGSFDLSQGSSSVSNPIADSMNVFFSITLLQPTTLLTLICLWIFPLAASFWHWRMAKAATSSWAFLDSPSQDVRLPPQEALQPLLALKIGLVGGLLYCILLLLIQIWRHANVSAAITNTDQFIHLFAFGRFVGGAILQAMIAAIIAVRVRRLGVLHGLFAAFVAGCVMTAGVCGSVLLYGQTIDSSFVWVVLGYMVNGGAILTLLTVPVVPALAGWIRRLQH
jgi:Zn-dependent protease with chaperone function